MRARLDGRIRRTTATDCRRPSPRPAAPTSLRRHHEPIRPSAHGPAQEAEQPELLAAAEGLRDLRRRPDAAEVPDGAHAAALHRVHDEERLRHPRHGGDRHDLPRRLRHPGLRHRLHAVLLRRQGRGAPQQDHHPRLLRGRLLPGHPARRAHRVHAPDLEPDHGRERLHHLLRYRPRDPLLHEHQRPAVHAPAPRASPVDVHRLHDRASPRAGAPRDPVPRGLPLGSRRLPGRQPAHGDPVEHRLDAHLHPQAPLPLGRGADALHAGLRDPGHVHRDLILLPQAQRPVLPAALPGQGGSRPVHGRELAGSAPLHRRHGVPDGLAAVALREAE